MRLEEYLRPEFVLDDLRAANKADLLAELVAPVGSVFPGFDVRKAHQVLMDRESLGTTGIGDGVAIPHGKLPDLSHILIIVGRSRGGVDFESLDFKPCHIFFLVLAPEHVAGMHLRILAHISRLLADEGFRNALLRAEGREDLWRLLTGSA
ncbi:MAG: PTS sugar transporter subunit IIA [Desulfovibrio sp.]|nr:PTS sugar transporter subunit IIA [Desulfovibrio sp.]